jgi:hypothetical protein
VGTIVTMRIKQQLLNDVGFKEKEIKDFEIVTEEGNIKWNPKAKDVEIEIGEQALKMIVEALDKSENLNEQYIELYDKVKGKDG